MATITIKFNDGSVGEWTNVSSFATDAVGELMLQIDRESGFQMDYEVVSNG